MVSRRAGETPEQIDADRLAGDRGCDRTPTVDWAWVRRRTGPWTDGLTGGYSWASVLSSRARRRSPWNRAPRSPASAWTRRIALLLGDRDHEVAQRLYEVCTSPGNQFSRRLTGRPRPGLGPRPAHQRPGSTTEHPSRADTRPSRAPRWWAR